MWRLTGEGNNATDIRPFDDDPMMAINLSVWTDLASLCAYVYRTDHIDIMRRRLILTGSTLRGRSIEFKTMVADEIFKTVWPYVEGGRLRPIIDSSFPLAEAAAAHARMEAGEHVGKIVLEVG